MLKIWKKYSPIGCRDLKTRDQFISYGIKAYFSSCLTTTLDIDFAVNEKERTSEIIFILIKRINSFNHLHLIILVILHIQNIILKWN